MKKFLVEKPNLEARAHTIYHFHLESIHRQVLLKVLSHSSSHLTNSKSSNISIVNQ